MEHDIHEKSGWSARKKFFDENCWFERGRAREEEEKRRGENTAAA